jgi:hypothetical protein
MFNQKSILAIVWLIITLLCNPLISLAEETPLDESNPPAETPQVDAQYSGPPAISFYLSDEDYLLIKVDGLSLQDVDGFMFAGMDISELVGQYEEQGIIELTEKENGFQMNVNLPIQQLAGQNEFGLLYGDGNKLSAVIDSEKLLAEATKESGDRGFGYTNVYGTLTKKSGCCYCGQCGTQYASYATVDFYTWNNGWVYRGSTTATASGYFDVYLQGYDAPYISVVASSGGQSNSVVLTGPACACTRATVKASMKLQ